MKREREKKSKYEKSIVPYNMLTMFPNGLRLMGNNGCLEYLAQGPSKICKKHFKSAKLTNILILEYLDSIEYLVQGPPKMCKGMLQKPKTTKYFDLRIAGLNENFILDCQNIMYGIGHRFFLNIS